MYSTYSRSVKVTTEPSQNFNSYNFIQVMEDFDVIKSMRHGSLSTTLATLDLVNRKFGSTNFNASQVANSALLNGNLPVNNLQNRLGLTQINTIENVLKFAVSSDSDPSFNPQNYQNWIPQYTTRLGQINSFKSVISIPGDIFMKAGAIINLIIPKMTTQTQATANDPLRTGNYLVASVKHSFVQDVSTTVLELLSDSVSTALPSAQQSSQQVSTMVTL